MWDVISLYLKIYPAYHLCLNTLGMNSLLTIERGMKSLGYYELVFEAEMHRYYSVSVSVPIVSAISAVSATRYR